MSVDAAAMQGGCQFRGRGLAAGLRLERQSAHGVAYVLHCPRAHVRWRSQGRVSSNPSRYERTRCFRRGWIFERVGWSTMAVILAAAAVGLFGGDGWLAESEAAAGDDLIVRYSRFCRARSPVELTVEWVPRTPEPKLWIARSYLDEFEIEEIHPAPSAVTLQTDRVDYAFRSGRPAARVEVTFRLKAEHGGPYRGRIGVDDGLEVEVRQLVFP
jgi:hypothetical protein